MDEPNWPLLLGVVWAVCGGFACFSIYKTWQLFKIRKEGESVTGQVIEVQWEEARGGPGQRPDEGGSYRVTVAYRVGNHEFHIQPEVNSNLTLYKEGQEVTICYYPESPERGLIVDRREIMKWGVIGIACLVPPCLLSIIAMNS
jgi:hypothetical protein